MTIVLTEEDLMRLNIIEVDRDAQEALAFVRERILPEVIHRVQPSQQPRHPL